MAKRFVPSVKTTPASLSTRGQKALTGSAASGRRFAEKREQRHREQTVAAWLRSLGR